MNQAVDNQSTPGVKPSVLPGHQSPRPFKPRGGKGKHAAYKHEWYLENRQRILDIRRAEYAKSPKKLLTPEERAKSTDKMAASKSRGWNRMPATRRQRVRQALQDGVATEQE